MTRRHGGQRVARRSVQRQDHGPQKQPQKTHREVDQVRRAGGGQPAQHEVDPAQEGTDDHPPKQGQAGQGLDDQGHAQKLNPVDDHPDGEGQKHTQEGEPAAEAVQMKGHQGHHAGAVEVAPRGHAHQNEPQGAAEDVGERRHSQVEDVLGHADRAGRTQPGPHEHGRDPHDAQTLRAELPVEGGASPPGHPETHEQHQSEIPP